MKQTVYIVSPESQQIHAWNPNHEGILALAQVVNVPGRVQPMVVSPSKRYPYVGVRPEFRILAYRIVPDDGALTFIAEFTLPGSPTHTSTDHQGQFVFVGSYNADNVSIACLEDGLPVGVVDVVEGPDDCHPANTSPDNRTLWVPTLKQDRICPFTVSGDGHLVAQDPTEATTVKGAGPRHMVFHPNERYAHCANKLNSSVDVQELKDPHGNIECVQALDMVPENFSDTRWVADTHTTPNGRYLYACNRTVSLITILSTSEDGSVLNKGDFQPAETQPHGFNADHSGKYLITVGQKSHYISVYEIVGGEGLLHEKGRHVVGQGPMWVVVNAH